MTSHWRKEGSPVKSLAEGPGTTWNSHEHGQVHVQIVTDADGERQHRCRPPEVNPPTGPEWNRYAVPVLAPVRSARQMCRL